MKKIELLAPAGDLEKLKIAVMYGANAVFIGGKSFSLRSRASNFTYEDIKAGCEFAHLHGAQVHVTCNILPHESDMLGLMDHLKKLEQCGVDAVIAASAHILKMVKQHTKMEAHVSTQETSINSNTVSYWVDNFHVDRVVLGRELSISEIKDICDKSPVDIEAFIHGGMCVSYSGRCMLSNNMTNRDANRGGCAHSCRWNYDLIIDENKINPDDEYFAMSSKDLCAIREIPQMIDAGVDSFKIEGRMKSLHYIATVVKAYRGIIDEYQSTGTVKDYDKYIDAINKAENRQTSYGFLRGNIGVTEQLYNARSEQPTQEFIGIVTKYDKENKIAYIEERNFFKAGSVIEIFGPDKEAVYITVNEIFDKDNNVLDAARHPGEIVHFKCDIELNEYDMMRLVRDENSTK